MSKKKVTEEMGLHKEWYVDAKNQTLETLPDFIKGLLDDYEHDYGTICHALTAGAIGSMWAMEKHPQGGITGFQAGCIMWEFIRNWNKTSNKTGLKLVDYDNMLYPQYEDKFDKTISKSTWNNLKKEATVQVNDKENGKMHEEVWSHMKAISEGVVPFGYTVDED